MSGFRPLGSVPISEAFGSLTNHVSVPKPSAAGVPPIRRLIVGLTQASAPTAAVSVGGNLVERIIVNAGVEKSAIHRFGDRRHGAAAKPKLTPAQMERDPYLMRDFEKKTRFARPSHLDFTGDWCDRVLLGPRSMRVGLLKPYDLDCVADSVAKALGHHPWIQPDDILFVSPELGISVGRYRLDQVRDDTTWVAADEVEAALAAHFRRPSMARAFRLGIGVGDVAAFRRLDDLQRLGVRADDALGEALETPLTNDEHTRMDEVLEIGAYAASLWVDDPDEAVRFASRRTFAVTDAAKAEFRASQKCLPSLRDEALTEAFLTGAPTANRMPPNMFNDKVDRMIESRQHKIAKEHARRDAAKSLAKGPRGGVMKPHERRRLQPRPPPPRPW